MAHRSPFPLLLPCPRAPHDGPPPWHLLPGHFLLDGTQPTGEALEVATLLSLCLELVDPDGGNDAAMCDLRQKGERN